MVRKKKWKVWGFNNQIIRGWGGGPANSVTGLSPRNGGFVRTRILGWSGCRLKKMEASRTKDLKAERLLNSTGGRKLTVSEVGIKKVSSLHGAGRTDYQQEWQRLKTH